MKFDYVIIGDGLTGLLLLRRIIDKNRGSVLLIGAPKRDYLRPDDMPSQTFWSQGIIHRGYKYSLEPAGGRMSLDETADRFERELEGQGIDMDAHTLQHNIMVVTDEHSQMPAEAIPLADHRLASCQRVALFPERVVDIWDILQELRFKSRMHIVESMIRGATVIDGCVKDIGLDGGMTVEPGCLMLCAGRNNGFLLDTTFKLSSHAVQQQRPIYVGESISPKLPFLQAHVIYKNKWELTVTSRQNAINRTQWRLGGPLFEVTLDPPRDRLMEVSAIAAEIFGIETMPPVKLTKIDRAERNTGGQRMLEDSGTCCTGNVVAGWPTKFIFIPALIDTMLISSATIL